MKTILIPSDFSKEANFALDFGIQLAEKNQAKLVLLHVVEYPIGATIDPIGVSLPQPGDAQFIETLMKNGKEKMEELQAKVNDPIPVETIVEMGNPYLNIASVIEDQDVDLVVMGTKGATGLKEVFIGSNAEKVVRNVHCPVIAIKHPRKVSEIKEIAFGSNFMEMDDVLMNHVKQLQDFFDAKLHLVRVNTPNNFEKDRNVLKLMEQTATRYMLKNYTVNIYNDIYEEEGIMHFAEDIEANLIALSTHGRKGLSHLLNGSIAEDVVNHSNIPIWTFSIK